MIPLIFISGLVLSLIGVIIMYLSVNYKTNDFGEIYTERDYMLGFIGIFCFTIGVGSVLGIITHMASVAIL